MDFSKLLFFVLLLSLTACGEARKKPSISFYHWKANMDISQAQMDYLDSLKLNKLYLRFFDVHWNKEKKAAFPISPLRWKYFDLGRKLEIVPVIYVTNIALEKTEYDRGIDSLALNISRKVKLMISEMDTVRFFTNEFQIDCDWNLETQSKFFRLINLLKKYLPFIKVFSATIRLHQVKYFTTTGVPPVDKGVLMFYNMGKIKERNEKNSILNLKTAQNYLENFDIYPLKMDVALPLFSWGLQFREQKIQQIINDISVNDLKDKSLYERITENEFKVLKSTYLNGIYIYKNDIIKLENIREADLKTAIGMLKKVFKPKKFDFIFYHLHDNILNTYKKDIISKLTSN
jgi:hypothetical protein